MSAWRESNDDAFLGIACPNFTHQTRHITICGYDKSRVKPICLSIVEQFDSNIDISHFLFIGLPIHSTTRAVLVFDHVIPIVDL